MIKAAVVYDKQANVDLMQYNIVSNPWKWAIYILATISSIVLLIFNIDSDYFAISVGVLICMVLLDLSVLYYYFISPKLEIRKIREDDYVTNYYEFDETIIKIWTEYKGKKEQSKLFYQKIYKVCEGKNAFYIFVDKYNTLIITKSAITGGSVDDLRAHLSAKVTGRKNKLSKV